jgi:undecaprenyl-diphosphatase
VIPGNGRPRGRGTRKAPGLSPARAALLGAVQGPTELLPVSSSAHLSLLPWFAGWELGNVDEATRKALDVMLHAGTGAALIVGQRGAIVAELRGADSRTAAFLALSIAPPAVAGYALERWIERRLGGPRSIAAGLCAGAVAMLVADRRPQQRGRGDLSAADGIALGLGQAAALVPGVSRGGATIAAARLRRFTRPEAGFLSRMAALPVIAGATVLKATRMRQRGIDPGLRRTAVAGAGAAFVSTLASQRLIGLVDRSSAWPYAAYRFALAGAITMRLRRTRSPSGPGPGVVESAS